MLFCSSCVGITSVLAMMVAMGAGSNIRPLPLLPGNHGNINNLQNLHHPSADAGMTGFHASNMRYHSDDTGNNPYAQDNTVFADVHFHGEQQVTALPSNPHASHVEHHQVPASDHPYLAWHTPESLSLATNNNQANRKTTQQMNHEPVVIDLTTPPNSPPLKSQRISALQQEPSRFYNEPSLSSSSNNNNHKYSNDGPIAVQHQETSLVPIQSPLKMIAKIHDYCFEQAQLKSEKYPGTIELVRSQKSLQHESNQQVKLSHAWVVADTPMLHEIRELCIHGFPEYPLFREFLGKLLSVNGDYGYRSQKMMKVAYGIVADLTTMETYFGTVPALVKANSEAFTDILHSAVFNLRQTIPFQEKWNAMSNKSQSILNERKYVQVFYAQAMRSMLIYAFHPAVPDMVKQVALKGIERAAFGRIDGVFMDVVKTLSQYVLH